MLISEDIYNNKSSMMYCMASFNSSYLVLFADDYFYNYAGKLVNIIITEMIHPDYVGEFKNVCESLKESGQSQRIITCIKGGDGQYFLVHMSLANHGNIINEEAVIDMNVVNIFMMEKKYTRLHNDVNKYRTYLSMYNDYMFDYDTVTDMFSLYIYRSFKATIICKMTLDKFEKVYMEYLNNARQKQDFTDFVNKVRNANEGFNGEITGPLITDMSKLVVYNIDCKLTYKNNRDRVVIGIIKSIDKQNEVSYYATQEGKDFFTGLLNKRACKEYVQDSIATNKDIHYMAMIDIDNFKNVNDTYGHKTGDELIQAFADVIRENTRDDDFVCRMGGDEFAVFFFELEEERVICERAESIIKDFAKIRTEMGCSMCSVSIGIMTKYYGGEELDCEQLYEKADQALYYVKNNGKDAYHLFESMPEDLKNNRQTGCQMDLDQLMRQVTERKYRPGAYAVEYDRFSFIYQFIARNVERNGQHVQVVLLSMELPEDKEISLERIEDSLVILESAIVRSLRRGDVTSRFSSTQQVVVLMDATKEDGVMVANRILKKYNALAKEAAIPAYFDIVEVPHAFSKRTEKNEEKA